MPNLPQKTPVFDFDKGEFVTINGHVKTVGGKEGLKVWVEKIIRTELNRYKIYNGTGYGVRLEGALIGHVYPKDYVRAELSQNIKNALLKNSDITDVQVNSVSVDGSRLTWDITVYTKYGTISSGGNT